MTLGIVAVTPSSATVLGPPAAGAVLPVALPADATTGWRSRYLISQLKFVPQLARRKQVQATNGFVMSDSDYNEDDNGLFGSEDEDKFTEEDGFKAEGSDGDVDWEMEADMDSLVETDLDFSPEAEQQEQEASSGDKPFPLPLVTGERGPYPGSSRVDPRRKRGGWRKPAHGLLILKPPMSNRQLAQRLLASPQLRLNSLPLLSSCLPIAPLQGLDKEWFQEYSLEVRDALGYATIDSGNFGIEDYGEPDYDNPDPAAHLDTLLYLAFQHEESLRGKKLRHARVGHLRLVFLGENVLELALAELLLQVYPKDKPASLRERAFGVTNKKGLESVLRRTSLYDVAFPDELQTRLIKKDRRLILQKCVFLGIIAAVYLSLGMSEVYRLLFETFGFDLDAKCTQPRERAHREDVDYVSADFKVPLTWKDIAYYKPPADAIFAAPRLFRACVPPGMYRFHRNLWEMQSLPHVMEVLGYPLTVSGDTREIAEARARELGLGLQLCFTHPSLYKLEHPRFCNERLEYLGSKIQDVTMAERLLMRRLDAPYISLHKEHRNLLMNRICGRRLRMKRLHKMIMYAEDRQVKFDTQRRLRNYSTNAVQQAIHGLAYAVYGKAEVRRLLLDVFEVERPLPCPQDFNDVLASQKRRYVDTLQPVY